MIAPVAVAAATAALDAPCYVAGRPGVLSLSGYAPGARVAVTSAELPGSVVTTDAAGALRVPFTPPSGDDLARPGSRAFTLTATATSDPASASTARALVAPLAFSSGSTLTSPTSARSWRFSGWTPGRPVYAHFRFAGRTLGTRRFGLAQGPCGLLTAHGPGIAVPGTVRPGTWTIQVDQARTFSPATRPRLSDDTVVFTTVG